MSRFPGPIQCAIKSVFRDNPSSTFSAKELTARIPNASRSEKVHRASVLRAAPAVMMKMWWAMAYSEQPDQRKIFYNLCDVMSYAAGKLRTYWGYPPETIQCLLTDQTSATIRWTKSFPAVPGGSGSIHQAYREGRHSEAVMMMEQYSIKVAPGLAQGLLRVSAGIIQLIWQVDAACNT